MKIISLEASNFKRLSAVSITPKGPIVEVHGNNAEGKSSTLDAIWAALGGKDASPSKPIHTGTDKAEIRLVLGDNGEPKYKVTRTYKLKEGVPYTTDLKVEGADGARFAKEQTLLDGFVGETCFDPLALLDMPDKDQIKSLRQFVPGVDFDAIEGQNQTDFETRTEVNRETKSLRAQADAITAPLVAPERVDVAGLEKKLGDAAAHNSTLERRKVQRENAVQELADMRERRDALQRQLAELEDAITDLDVKLIEAEALPEPIDVADVQTKLGAGRQTNTAADAYDRRKALEEKVTASEVKAEALTKAIEKRKADMAKAVLAAKMPVPGLGFGDGFVTLNGEPLAQASRAQQIRASVAIAAAMNPKLRVAIIKDGSLLDKKSWAALTEYAQEHDMQIWVESLQPHTSAAVLIEDGGTRTAEAEPAAADVGDVI